MALKYYGSTLGIMIHGCNLGVRIPKESQIFEGKLRFGKLNLVYNQLVFHSYGKVLKNITI
jgi:hypothetical protein